MKKAQKWIAGLPSFLNWIVGKLDEYWLLQELLLGLAAFSVLCIASQLAFFLPFTPVPITFGPQGPLFVATFLSPTRAFLWTLHYVLCGFAGAPVFAGLLSGIGPSTGFIMAYPITATIASYLLQKIQKRSYSWMQRSLYVYFSSILATLPIYCSGFFVLKWSLSISSDTAMALGVYPFIFGCLFLKIPLFTQALALASSTGQEKQ